MTDTTTARVSQVVAESGRDRPEYLWPADSRPPDLFLSTFFACPFYPSTAGWHLARI